jgi:RNA polymerase sigma-70 factor, ECF subfamily
VGATLKEAEEEGRGDGTTRTLGALLYGNGATGRRVPERGWLTLVESVAAGDQSALRALYDRTHRIVFTLIMRIVDDRESAEELTVDVFHEVWRRAAKYDPAAGSVIGWIMNLARSRAIDRLRFDRRKKRLNVHTDVLTRPSADPCGESLEFEQRGQALRKALMVLTAAERQAIETTFFSELTYAEAARWLNQPQGTVKTRIRAGLTKLRIALASERERA